MRKNLLLLLLFCIATIAKAQDEPVITLTATTDATQDLSLGFMVAEANTKLFIDWGDGNKVETPVIQVTDDYESPTVISGKPLGEGNIKIYGNGITVFDGSFAVNAPKIISIDFTKSTDLLKLNVTSNALTTLDITKNTKLVKLDCLNNQLTALDISQNTLLTSLDCTNNIIKKLDVSKCTLLSTLKCSKNKFTSIDLTKNTELKNLYCLDNAITKIDLSKNILLSYISLNNCKLTSLDVTNCAALGTLFCMNNDITDLKASYIKTTLNCTNNKLKLSALPAPTGGFKNYLCTPQRIIPTYLQSGDVIDLSSEVNIKGFADAPQPTTFVWKAGTTVLAEGSDYTAANGSFTFTRPQTSPIVCEMINATAFPTFTGTKVFKTSTAEFYEPTELISLKAETTATIPLDLEFAGLGTGIKLQIDWGNGIKVSTDEIAMTDDYGTKTKVSGKPLGEGNIKIYGIKLAELQALWTKPETEATTYPKISSIDVTKAIDLQELTVASHALTAIDISQNTKLTELFCYGNQIQSLAPVGQSLLKLDCKNNLLETLDITQCPVLTTLDAQGNKLKQISLTNNTALDNILLLNNQLESLDCSTNTKILTLNLNNNKLSSLDVTNCEVLERLFCMNNNLTELNAGYIKTSATCVGNKFTFENLPIINTKTYTYAPQQDLAIATTINAGVELDLSAQNNAKGILDEAQQTTYTWKTADGLTTLAANQDYTENNGKFTFKAAQIQPVYCEMTSPAFPAFTDTKVFKTTQITVNAAPVNIDSENMNAVRVYTEGKNLVVNGLNGSENIHVYSIQGAKIAEMNATGSDATFSLSTGQYIILINNVAHKAIIR